MTDPLLFLVVDDCPGRYDEFFRLLDRAKHRWVQTHDPDLVQDLVDRADVLVLDPFGGGGTTALVARRAGRRFVHVDLNPAYLDIARRRLDGEHYQGNLLTLLGAR